MKNRFPLLIAFISLFYCSTALTQSFVHKANLVFPEYYDAELEFFDADNDGDLDFMMNGRVARPYSHNEMSLFKNDGNWHFSNEPLTDNLKLCAGQIRAWDQDGNGLVDLSVNAYYYYQLVKNNANETGGFISRPLNLAKVYMGDWMDFDNDGFADLITKNNNEEKPCRIFRYSNGEYMKESWDYKFSRSFDPVFTDVDNDGDLDAVMADMNGKANIRLNDGNGNLNSGELLGGFDKRISNVYPIDLNNDGGMDFVFIPYERDMIYWMINDTQGNFTYTRTKFIKRYNQVKIESLDVDNDGDLDVFIMYSEFGTIEDRIQFLRNDGDLKFTELDFESPIDFKRMSSGDLDGDGDIDMAIIGGPSDDKVFLMQNQWVELGNEANEVPTTPNEFRVVYDNKLYLSWEQSTDKETADEALSYDIQFYLNGALFIAGAADPISGYNRIPSRIGRFRGEKATINCQDWPSGTYTCKLIAIDNQQSNSGFVEATFIIPEAPLLEEITLAEDYLPQLNFKIADAFLLGKLSVQRKGTEDAYFKEIMTIEAGITSYIDSSAERGFTYQYRVQSVLNGKYSGVSNVQSFQMGPLTLLPLIENVQNFVWFDFNHDAYPDLIGEVSHGDYSEINLYVNEKGKLTQKFGIRHTWIQDIHLSDLDGDNVPEIILKGDSIRFLKITADGIYPSEKFKALKGYLVTADADFDGNGFNDLIIWTNSHSEYKHIVYKNKGNGVLVEIIESGLENMENQAHADDVNLDGFPDLIEGKLAFINKGNFRFEEVSLVNEVLDFRKNCDINQDDIFDRIWDENELLKVELSNNESEVFSYELPGYLPQDYQWIDYNADGQPDITYSNYLNGSNMLWVLKGNVLNNNKIDVPKLAQELKVSLLDTLCLSWKAATDAQNSQDKLRYRYYLLDENTNTYLVPTTNKPGELSEGIGFMGYATKATKACFTDLPAGNYKWGVQTLDMHGQVSAFASGPDFEIKPAIDIKAEALNHQAIKLTWTDVEWADSLIVERSKAVRIPYVSNLVFKEIGRCLTSDLAFIDQNAGREFGFIYRVRAFSETNVSQYTESSEVSLTDFTHVNGINLLQLKESKAVWLDANSDGEMDLFLTGRNNEELTKAVLYLNKAGQFTASSQTFIGLADANVQVEDVNRDNHLDIILTGKSQSGLREMFIYLNQTDGTFEETKTWLPNNSSLNYSDGFDLGDVDNNGTPDCFASEIAYTNTGYYFAKIDGFDQGSNKTVHIYDFNKDNMNDLYFGSKNNSDYSYLLNKGDGFFEGDKLELIDFSTKGDIMIDANADGWMDVICYGYFNDNTWPYLSEGLARINNDGIFSDEKINLQRAIDGMAGKGDYDNNGLPDMIIAGGSDKWGNNQNSQLYYYSNIDNFEFLTIGSSYSGLLEGSIEMADYDNDGDLDFVMTGSDKDDKGRTALYSCNVVNTELSPANQVPSIPQNPRIEFDENQFTLIWDESSDDHTPKEALTYNVWIQNDDGDWVISPKSDVSTGQRLLPQHGNAGSNLSHLFISRQRDVYRFAVQAVDNAYKASAFSEVVEFGLGINTSIEDEIDGLSIISKDGKIRINNSLGFMQSELNVVDIKGRIIYKNKLSGDTHTVYTQQWATGIYIIKIRQKDKLISRKVFIE